MPNGLGALSILGGAVDQQSGPVISALAKFKQVRQRETELRQTFFNSKNVQSDINYFKKNVS